LAFRTNSDALLGFLEVIAGIRSDLSALGPGKMMDRVLKSLPILTVASLAYGSYRSQLAPLNILKIHKHALQADADPVMTPYRFVKTFESYSKEAKESSQEPVADEGSEAVRVLTIHKAKGLDFPIVFVPLTDSMTSSFRNSTDVLHDWETDIAGLYVRPFTDATYLRLKYGPSKQEEAEPESYLLMKEGINKMLEQGLTGSTAKTRSKKATAPETEKEFAKIANIEPRLAKLNDEERRVLYVAATRAKRQLIFCYVPNPEREDQTLGGDI